MKYYSNELATEIAEYLVTDRISNDYINRFVLFAKDTSCSYQFGGEDISCT